jgi:hypothetical protein
MDLRVALLPCLLASTIAVACGSTTPRNGFGSEPDASEHSPDGSIVGDDEGGKAYPDGSLLGDGDTSTSPGCVNLQCAATDCAAQGKPETSLTGTIRDPAGNLPLYNVYVYVPNATPAPITPGNPTCTPCEAPASGNPILGTSTDTDGHFDLQKGTGDMWGVPAGANIPLVIQVGKWRRQLVIPQVDACTAVDLDTVLGPDKMRLPKMSSEGDMPLIALTTAGYDAFECFLRGVGVDDSEFVPPGSTAGHVQIYTGAFDDPNTPASSIAGGNTVEDTFQWWNSAANLLKYDFVLNGCDGVQAGSRGSGYSAMESYLDGGGRTFVTDFFVDWFSPPDAPAVDATVASWPGWDNAMQYGSYFIDTSFPKGQAFGQWLVTNGIAQQVGSAVQIGLTDTWPDVNGSGPPTYPASTRWIYNTLNPGDPASTSYLSFNTPVGTAADKQCGRAVFSGVHVYLPDNVPTFPDECGTEGGQASAYAINQKALEFLFFDLSSCVQNDQQPPTPPPPAQ